MSQNPQKIRALSCIKTKAFGKVKSFNSITVIADFTGHWHLTVVFQKMETSVFDSEMKNIRFSVVFRNLVCLLAKPMLV